MDLQIALLRAIRDGELPATPQRLIEAFNKDVVTARAVSAQQRAVDTSMEVLETERERLEELVRQQRQRNRELRDLLNSNTYPPQDNSPPNIEKLRSLISTLATKYVAPLGMGDPQAVEKVLWRLVEVGSRGEQLIVPADMPVVALLGDEGLIETEPAYAGQLRIRLV